MGRVPVVFQLLLKNDGNNPINPILCATPQKKVERVVIILILIFGFNFGFDLDLDFDLDFDFDFYFHFYFAFDFDFLVTLSLFPSILEKWSVPSVFCWVRMPRRVRGTSPDRDVYSNHLLWAHLWETGDVYE